MCKTCDSLGDKSQGQVSASARSIELRKEEALDSSEFACSSAILKGSRGGGRGLEMTHCTQRLFPVMCALGLAPTCPLVLLSPQYFSTLENSIVSLFVLLST